MWDEKLASQVSASDFHELAALESVVPINRVKSVRHNEMLWYWGMGLRGLFKRRQRLRA
jgi:hypothetical protein